MSVATSAHWALWSVCSSRLLLSLRGLSLGSVTGTDGMLAAPRRSAQLSRMSAHTKAGPRRPRSARRHEQTADTDAVAGTAQCPA